MKYYSLLFIAFFIILLSCNSGSSELSNTTATEETKDAAALSNLEKEHQLDMAAYADSVNAGLVEDTFKGSARRESKGKIGDAEVIINYGSPGVRGRVIWNGLVSYDQIWVSGSHWATAISFSDAVTIADQHVPAGMYGFFTIPGREKWTLVLNEVYDQHLADDYEQSRDILRFETDPIALEDTVQRLTYEVVSSEGQNSGIIAMSWDKIRLELPVSVD
ncbi:Protein of unknown function [Cyclobacterium lianum]|uniref:DUF2911 domain-containing protein n=1 Tax=Cyclobacterium lianum TaxID=388280 RepID=A0A1M7P0L7_9BACT|nr:DUF2911 domain-containing protein [Cyclobacterium lianum]SHN09478.1 Protein of unknown function [Cyclobacterium lianum]